MSWYENYYEPKLIDNYVKLEKLHQLYMKCSRPKFNQPVKCYYYIKVDSKLKRIYKTKHPYFLSRNRAKGEFPEYFI